MDTSKLPPRPFASEARKAEKKSAGVEGGRVHCRRPVGGGGAGGEGGTVGQPQRTVSMGHELVPGGLDELMGL